MYYNPAKITLNKDRLINIYTLIHNYNIILCMYACVKSYSNITMSV